MEAVGPFGDGSDLGIRALGAAVRESRGDVRENAVEMIADCTRELLKGGQLGARCPTDPFSELVSRDVHLSEVEEGMSRMQLNS